ncbi:MAG TPA: hypothetical protein VJC18_04920, partial [bacterium]|nr:hypothetical protein [bacterium]
MVTETENNKTPRFRIFIVSLFFCFFYTVIIFRAYMLQIHGNEKLSNLATSQHNANLRVSPQRGTIFDRKGEILAIDVPVASVGIHPHQIQDKDQVIKLLAEHTSLNLKQLAEKLASTKKFEWIERRIPIDNGR